MHCEGAYAGSSEGASRARGVHEAENNRLSIEMRLLGRINMIFDQKHMLVHTKTGVMLLYLLQ